MKPKWSWLALAIGSSPRTHLIHQICGGNKVVREDQSSYRNIHEEDQLAYRPA